MVNQKDAVFNVVSEVVQVREGEAVTLTKEERATCLSMITTALQSGEVIVSEAKQAKMTEEKHYRDYAQNILNNWTRKDLRLNGGKPYEAKNPGSRAGSGDEQVKELKKLRSSLTDAEQIALVDQAITERLTELKAQQNAAKIEEVNFDLIPQFAHLSK